LPADSLSVYWRRISVPYESYPVVRYLILNNYDLAANQIAEMRVHTMRSVDGCQFRNPTFGRCANVKTASRNTGAINEISPNQQFAF
jgi:hypothetical protein